MRQSSFITCDHVIGLNLVLHRHNYIVQIRITSPITAKRLALSLVRFAFTNEIYFDWNSILLLVISTDRGRINACVCFAKQTHSLRFQWNRLSSSSWKEVNAFFVFTSSKEIVKIVSLPLYLSIAPSPPLALITFFGLLSYTVIRSDKTSKQVEMEKTVLFTWHFA